MTKSKVVDSVINSDCSIVSNEDSMDMENVINEWIHEGDNDKSKYRLMQDKVKGAISILNKIDNVKVYVTRNSKNSDVKKVSLQVINT